VFKAQGARINKTSPKSQKWTQNPEISLVIEAQGIHVFTVVVGNVSRIVCVWSKFEDQLDQFRKSKYLNERSRAFPFEDQTFRGICSRLAMVKARNLLQTDRAHRGHNVPKFCKTTSNNKQQYPSAYRSPVFVLSFSLSLLYCASCLLA
jgi:hypothetical protein